MKTDKMRPFNQSTPNGRNFDGYGNTHLDDESRSPWFILIGSIVFMLFGLAVML